MTVTPSRIFLDFKYVKHCRDKRKKPIPKNHSCISNNLGVSQSSCTNKDETVQKAHLQSTKRYIFLETHFRAVFQKHVP